MTLVKGGRNGVENPAGGAEQREDPDKIPAEIPRHGSHGTPKIRIGDSAKFSHYKRASSYGKPIESEYLINLWKLRAAIFGTSRNASIRDRLAAVPVFECKEQPERHKKIRDELNGLVEEAIDVARTKDRALRGTALHLLTEQRDQGVDLSHLDGNLRKAVEKWARIMERFTIHGAEQFVVHDEYELGGSYDRLVSPVESMTAPDGTVITPEDRIILDLKSGDDQRYWSSGYRAQQAGYAGGQPYFHRTDAEIAAGATCRPGWPDGIKPHQGWALIPHIPADNPDDTGLVWVDLAEGREDLDIARRIYQRRSAAEKDVGFHECTVPGLLDVPAETGPSREERLDELVGYLHSVPDMTGVHVLYKRWGPGGFDVWNDECNEIVKSRRAELVAGERQPA